VTIEQERRQIAQESTRILAERRRQKRRRHERLVRAESDELPGIGGSVVPIASVRAVADMSDVGFDRGGCRTWSRRHEAPPRRVGGRLEVHRAECKLRQYIQGVKRFFGSFFAAVGTALATDQARQMRGPIFETESRSARSLTLPGALR
jgi:hypothetical protein